MQRRKPESEQQAFPLEAGDRLTRSEFERRYCARPDIKKAELIEGIVYVPSPARHRRHARPNALIVTWLTTYALRTPGIDFSDNGTIRMDLDNEPQPDALLRIPMELGGRSRIEADDYLAGAPELIAEVSSSSASYDLGVKKDAYRRNGVQEYVVWRVLDNAIDWFTLDDGTFARLVPSADGLLRSVVFPGLWLDTDSLLADRTDRLLDVLQQGLSSPEHAEFVQHLQASARPRERN